MYRQKYIFLLPGLLVLVAIILFPLLFTIRVSFSSWDVYNPGLNWIGGENYARLWEDARYWEALTRLSVLTVGTVLLQYTLGFALALLVWRDIAARRFFRVLFLVPMMTTPVVMSVIWRTIFHESLGPLNPILDAIGIGAQPWLSQAGHAFAAVMIVEVWQWTPFMFLLLLAGLLSLPNEPFLAARIDGAGPIRTFLSVTFPMMGAISVGAILIRLIEASKLMETVYVLTSGGPGTSTETTSYYIFAAADRPSCEEVIDLPEGITDWKFRAVARQAYFRVAMSRRLGEGSCACLFDGFSFDAFVTAALGKSTAELTDADRPALERIRNEDRRATEARFRELEQSCLAK